MRGVGAREQARSDPRTLGPSPGMGLQGLEMPSGKMIAHLRVRIGAKAFVLLPFLVRF